MAELSKSKGNNLNFCSLVFISLYGIINSFVGLVGMTLFFSIKYASQVIGSEGFLGLKLTAPEPFLISMGLLFISGIMLHICSLINIKAMSSRILSILTCILYVFNLFYQIVQINRYGIYWIGKAIFEGQSPSQNRLFQLAAFSVLLLTMAGIVISVMIFTQKKSDGR